MRHRRLTLAAAILLITLTPRVLLMLPAPARAAAAYVQSDACFQASSTPACAFGSNTGAGNVLMGYASWSSETITLNSVSGCSNTWVIRNNPQTAVGHRGAMFYAENASGGACTVTLTMSSSVDTYMLVSEASGVLTSGAFDGSAMNVQGSPGTGTDAVTSTSITTTADGDFIFCATQAAPGFSPTMTPGTGYTGRESGSNGLRLADRVQTSAGSIACTFTSDNSGNIETITGVMAFKASGGGGGGGARSRVLGGGIL